MLDSETKRRIDSCLDILVGKVPDPKSQVEQITIALIYKFMDDMDAEAEELGGKRSFFAGDYARFGWAKLMSPSLPAGVFNLYSGVKTSILILDKRLHKQLSSVLFVKVGNDGFNLGAQRRAVVNSDLPEATRLLRGWMTAPEKFEGDGAMAQAVERTRLGENGDFNLSGERYVIGTAAPHGWRIATLGELCRKITDGSHMAAELSHAKDSIVNEKTITLTASRSLSIRAGRAGLPTGHDPFPPRDAVHGF
jgi:hypothetical protein